MTEILKSVENLLDFNFVIENYQRGYRWNTSEVYSLLTDIYEFEPDFQSFYCLQPFVLKIREGKNTFELIDGQQRATTIFLILQYFENKSYKLFYTTRNSEETNLNSFLNEITKKEYPKITFNEENDDFNSIDSSISKYWKDNIIKHNKNINSVDNFYFYKSYCVIKNWIDNIGDEKEMFKNKLLNLTKVIWYVEKEEIDDKITIQKFINFNEGKIELEQPELIKALFVLDILKKPNLIQRQFLEDQFAEDWNYIEHQMSDEKFWQFVSNNQNDQNISNKINLLFQLYNGYGKDEDRFYNYRKFEKKFKNSVSDYKHEWEMIIQLFNNLEEWYQDRVTYHLVGAVIHLTKNNVSKILELSQISNSKQEFRNSLRNVLKQEFKEEKYNIDILKYPDIKIFKLLFFYNIALTNNETVDNFFPFYKFYNVKNWNIEHILAKNDDGLDNFDEFNYFSKDLKNLIEVISEDEFRSENKSNLIKLLEDLDEFISQNKKSECKKKIKEINEKFDEYISIDELSNLCLLDQTSNIKIGKNPFYRKRDIILGLDDNIIIEEESYIPIGTNFVFSKNTTKSEYFQSNYWSVIDRENYKNNIKKTIEKFLKHEQDEPHNEI